jgi:hypothetical protein
MNVYWLPKWKAVCQSVAYDLGKEREILLSAVIEIILALRQTFLPIMVGHDQSVGGN